MAKAYRGGATVKNSSWKISGGSNGRTTSKNYGATSAHYGVAPLKGSSGGKQYGGRVNN